MVIFQAFAAGATGNFIGEHISQAIRALLLDQEFQTINDRKSAYLSATLAGGFAGLVIPKLHLFTATFLAVSLNYALFDVIDRMMGGPGQDRRSVVADIVFDTIVIYYIIIFIRILFKLFGKEELISKKNKGFFEVVLTTLIVGSVINFYGNFRDIIFRRNQTNQQN